MMRKLALFLFLGLFVSSCQALSEAEALLAIKSKIGSNSYAIQNWISGSDPCNDSWARVTCKGNNVVILNLTNAGLIGNISTEFGDLINLQVLDLQSNSLTGNIPSSFQNLVNLQALNMSRNPLGVSFPDVLLSMTQLIDIRFGGSELIGQLPNGIGNLSSLKFLHINNNSLSGNLPEELYTLQQLEQLNLWGNPLKTNLSTHLGYLKNLKFLKIHNCELFGELPAQWGQNFTHMDTLYLNNNYLTGPIPDAWGNMTSLSELKLSDNRLSGTVPSWLNNASLVNTWLTCNFFTGVRPTLAFSKYKSLDGNCYTGEKDNRKGYCADGESCYPSHGLKPWAIALIVIAITCVVVALITLIYLRWWRKRKRHHKRRRKPIKLDTDSATSIKDFSLQEISRATNKFSEENQIGVGGFGKVYLGHLQDGRPIAIKVAHPGNMLDSAQFENEIRLLSRLHHRHLVHLLGWCDDDDSQILVYEYMKNGNLQDRLLAKKWKPLDFYQRVDIAVGVARGLDYLHSFADPPVIHRDMKPSNILLDDNLVAKISDFGISKDTPMLETHVSTRPAGTAGYLDPEYFLRQQLTTASDVYAFGVILLQLVTGQEAIDQHRSREINLVEWVRETLKLGGIQEVVDPRLDDNYPKEIYEQITTLGLQCGSLNKNDRPGLKDVLHILEALLSKLTKPEMVEDETTHLINVNIDSDSLQTATLRTDTFYPR